MLNALLWRKSTDDQGTTGTLIMPGFQCDTLELPWRDNATGKSCIPPGVYTVKPFQSKKLGSVFAVLNVPGRDLIRIHSGTFAGDRSKGYASHVLGCILVGHSLGSCVTARANKRQVAIWQSKTALRHLREHIAGQTVKLHVIG